MAEPAPDQRLSQIETHWTELLRARAGAPDAVARAQSALIVRYAGAIERYLLKVTDDRDLTDDLTQEFALRFLRGDFRTADPSRGRFRDFVKQAILNLMRDSYRRRRSRPDHVPIEGDGSMPIIPAVESIDLDASFLASWRETLMARAWEGLYEHERVSGQPFHTVLRCRADNPELYSPGMAEILSKSLGKTVTGNWVRQMLFRAREEFVDVLIEEVARTLHKPDRERVEEELAHVGQLVGAWPRPPSGWRNSPRILPPV
jgi:RNA polymerase sigma-70 factor (ECF subfamily)